MCDLLGLEFSNFHVRFIQCPFMSMLERYQEIFSFSFRLLVITVCMFSKLQSKGVFKWGETSHLSGVSQLSEIPDPRSQQNGKFHSLKINRLYIILCAILYHLFNLKNMKNKYWRSVTFSKVTSWSNSWEWTHLTYVKSHPK